MAFFQYPNKCKNRYTSQRKGKNPLRSVRVEISKYAKLNKNFTNYQIQKTIATAFHRSGFSFQEIVNVTKHKTLDSLKDYVPIIGPYTRGKGKLHNFNLIFFRSSQYLPPASKGWERYCFHRCLSAHRGAGLPHLHPIMLPLVPCPFQGLSQ